MTIEFGKIKLMSDKKIYNELSPIFNKIYNSFRYLKMSEQEYLNNVLKEISHSKSANSNIPNYNDYISKKVYEMMSFIVENKLANDKTAVELINNYINEYFLIENKNYTQDFKLLDIFFEKYDFIPSPDFITDILNTNQKFLYMIEKIFEENEEAIINENVEYLFNSKTLVLTLEIYCGIKDIEIKKNLIDTEYYEENIPTIDSLNIYLNEIGKYKTLSREEEKELIIKIKQGDTEAKDFFIKSNLKLVVNIAKKRLTKGHNILDFIQEGNIGLITAIKRFDITKGYRFSTYATHWINQAISRSLPKNRNIAIPYYLYEKLCKYIKIKTHLEQILNREPSIEEIEKEMGIPKEEIEKLEKLQEGTVSINSLVKDGEDTELEDFLKSEEKTPEEITIENELPHQIKKMLKNSGLSKREMEILLLRNGFYSEKPIILEEVGNIFGITRERARQIECIAIRKIRTSKGIKEIEVYLPKPISKKEKIDIYSQGQENIDMKIRCYQKSKTKK